MSCTVVGRRLGLTQTAVSRAVPRGSLGYSSSVKIFSRAVIKGRQIRSEDRPKDIKVDGVIPVNDPVAHADGFTPWHLGMAGPEIIRNAIRRLADLFHQADERHIQVPVGMKILAGSSPNHFHCVARVVQHVPHSRYRIMRRHKVPRGVRGLPAGNPGSRNPGVFRSTFRSNSWERSSSMEKKANPGVCPVSNSTRTSTSLSGPKSPRSTEPKRPSRRMRFRRQNSAICFFGALIRAVITLPLWTNIPSWPATGKLINKQSSGVWPPILGKLRRSMAKECWNTSGVCCSTMRPYPLRRMLGGGVGLHDRRLSGH